MADERIVGAVKIVDPTTTSQQATVDASGNLAIDIAAASATVTVDSELPAAVALADNASNPTVPGVGGFAMWFDGTTWDRARGDSVDGLLVNLGSNNDVTVTGTVTVDTELPAAAALADGTSNPTVPGVGSFLQGFNGTTWDRVRVANSGRLQVDVITGGGTDSPTNPTVDVATSAAVAAGAAADLNSAEITEAEQLWGVDITSSVPFKGIIRMVENGVDNANHVVVFGRAGETVQWRAPHRSFFTHAGASAGLDVFQVEFTNMDTSEAADAYATFMYST